MLVKGHVISVMQDNKCWGLMKSSVAVAGSTVLHPGNLLRGWISPHTHKRPFHCWDLSFSICKM